jgi:hypothetical protein
MAEDEKSALTLLQGLPEGLAFILADHKMTSDRSLDVLSFAEKASALFPESRFSVVFMAPKRLRSLVSDSRGFTILEKPYSPTTLFGALKKAQESGSSRNAESLKSLDGKGDREDEEGQDGSERTERAERAEISGTEDEGAANSEWIEKV